MTSSCAVEQAAVSGLKETGDINTRWFIKLSETWHAMSQVLGLKRLQELIQGTSGLSNEPAWLLGIWYGLHSKDDNTACLPEEMYQLLLEDFSTKLWFTYRRDFLAIGSTGLTSDVGWGCTIRSGQMLMAEALTRCWQGRTTRRHHAGGAAPHRQLAHGTDNILRTAAGVTVDSDPAAQQQASAPLALGPSSSHEQQLLELFIEQPGPSAPFSIHNICEAGAAHGVVVGEWLGPWVLCKALAAAAAAAAGDQEGQQQQQLGLHVHVVCDPGGGAPALAMTRLRELMTSISSSSISGSKQQQQTVVSSRASVAEQQQEGQQGLVILIPLTLGVGKVNERYLPQLSAVLTFPQSVGIVGGRPGSSLYFLGVQGSSVIYLDPHEVQQAAQLPSDMSTYHCCSPRLMPLAAIDPSLAIGFYCSTTDDLDDLSSRLQQLTEVAGGAPLMTIAAGDCRLQQQLFSSSSSSNAGGEVSAAAEDWELV